MRNIASITASILLTVLSSCTCMSTYDCSDSHPNPPPRTYNAKPGCNPRYHPSCDPCIDHHYDYNYEQRFQYDRYQEYDQCSENDYDDYDE